MTKDDLIREYVMADARVKVLNEKYGDCEKPREFWDAQQERRLLAYRIVGELDPPAKIDTTLRGWVMVTDDLSCSTVMMALESGLTFWPEPDYPAVRPWSVVEREGLTVRALTPEDIGYRVRKWDEWSEEEQYELSVARLDGMHNAYITNLAIDIATRQEDV